MAEGHQDCEKTKDELQRRLTAAESRAEALEKGNKALGDRFAALEGSMNDTIKKAVQEAAAAARLTEKRQVLADLLRKKPEEVPGLDATPEPALDAWIAREREFRGRADGTRLHGGAGGAGGDETPEVVDGIATTPYGFTVVEPLTRAAKTAPPAGGAN